jgi:hypothetical protein
MGAALVAMVECKACHAHFDPRCGVDDGSATIAVCQVCGTSASYEPTDLFMRQRPLALG